MNSHSAAPEEYCLLSTGRGDEIKISRRNNLQVLMVVQATAAGKATLQVELDPEQYVALKSKASASKKEIERKFLISRLPDLHSFPHQPIRQGYIVITNDGKEVRLRQSGAKYFLTIKGEGLLERLELEIEIRKDQFLHLWDTTLGKRLEKIRYVLPEQGLKVEVDIYEGHLSGLKVAEVEFSSLERSSSFVVPEWFGAEVTMDKRFKNKNLAVYGI